MIIQEELLAWAMTQVEALGACFTQANPIPGDAGFRHYIRLDTVPPMLAVYGPPEVEQHEAFVRISRHWRAHGIPAPHIYAYDDAKGFLLVQDFGAVALSDQLLEASTLAQVSELYAPALSQLRRLQQIPSDGGYPEYSAQRLQQEMALFESWFVEGLLGHRLTEAEKHALQTLYDTLIASALGQPQVLVHRDFHSRNIQCPAEGIGIIDFQDAVVGPMTYDWVSLLKDCYQQWPRSFVVAEVKQCNAQLPQGLKIPDATLLQTFDFMGLQRHLKVLGIFARLFLRDAKAGYLEDLPLVIAYVRETSHRYAPCQPFAQWFDRIVLPLCEQQPWYRLIEIQP